MHARVDQFLPLAPRDYLILFALSQGERHGYGIVADVEDQTEGVIRMDPSNLYRSLKRLIQQGLVREASERRAADAANERRRFYGITKLGHAVVQAEALRLSKLAAAARARKLIPKTEPR